MSKKIRNIMALIQLDVHNVMLNKSMLMIVIVPFVFGGVMNRLYEGIEEADMVYGNFAFYMSVMMAVGVVGGVSMPTIIIEEKERKTIRILRQSGITDGEFFTAKSVSSIILAELTCLAAAAVTRVQVNHIPLLILLTLAVMLIFCFLGISICMFVNTQMEVGVYSAPLVLVFMFPAMLSGLSDTLNAIATYTPLNAMMQLFWYGTGTQITEIHTDMQLIIQPGLHLLVLLSWIVGTGLLCFVLYKKKGFACTE